MNDFRNWHKFILGRCVHIIFGKNLTFHEITLSVTYVQLYTLQWKKYMCCTFLFVFILNLNAVNFWWGSEICRSRQTKKSSVRSSHQYVNAVRTYDCQCLLYSLWIWASLYKTIIYNILQREGWLYLAGSVLFKDFLLWNVWNETLSIKQSDSYLFYYTQQDFFESLKLP